MADLQAILHDSEADDSGVEDGAKSDTPDVHLAVPAASVSDWELLMQTKEEDGEKTTDLLAIDETRESKAATPTVESPKSPASPRKPSLVVQEVFPPDAIDEREPCTPASEAADVSSPAEVQICIPEDELNVETGNVNDGKLTSLKVEPTITEPDQAVCLEEHSDRDESAGFLYTKRMRLSTIADYSEVASPRETAIDMQHGDSRYTWSPHEEKESQRPGEVNVLPSIGYLELYRYADCWDRVALALGTLAAAACGVGAPLAFLFFGDVIHAFVTYGKWQHCGFEYSACLQMGRIPNDTNITEFEKILKSEVEGPEHLKELIEELAVIYAIIGAATWALGLIQVFCWVASARRQTKKIRIKFFRSILNQDIGYFDVNSAGELNSRLAGDVDRIQAGIGDTASMVVMNASRFAASLSVGFASSWQVSLVVLAWIPILCVAAGFLYMSIGHFARKELRAYAKAGGIAEQAIAGIRTVTAFEGQEIEVQKYADNLRPAKRVGLVKGFSQGCAMGFLFFTLFGVFAAALRYGFVLIDDDVIDIDKLVAAFFAVLLGGFSLGQVGSYIESLELATEAARNVFQVIDRKPAIDSFSERGDKPMLAAGEITFSNVSFAYPTRPGVQVLNNTSLVAETGKTTALCGQSGCGKSTVIQLIQRFYDPQQGEILLDGTDIRKLNVRWLRKIIGVVSQEPCLFDTTIEENIRFGCPGVSFDDVVKAAELASAYDFIQALPRKFQTVVGESGGHLSGGQKQRVAIARAIVRDPKIMLLDEATSALDSASEAIVQSALDKAAKGRTTIVVAHRLSTIRNADTIVGLYNGQVKESGSHAELVRAEHGIYANLVRMQSMATVRRRTTVFGSAAATATSRSTKVSSVTASAVIENGRDVTPSVGADDGIVVTPSAGTDEGRVVTPSAGATESVVTPSAGAEDRIVVTASAGAEEGRVVTTSVGIEEGRVVTPSLEANESVVTPEVDNRRVIAPSGGTESRPSRPSAYEQRKSTLTGSNRASITPKVARFSEDAQEERQSLQSIRGYNLLQTDTMNMVAAWIKRDTGVISLTGSRPSSLAPSQAKQSVVTDWMRHRPSWGDALSERSRFLTKTADQMRDFESNDEDLKPVSFCRIMRLNAPECCFIFVGCVASCITGGATPFMSLFFAGILDAFTLPGGQQQTDDMTYFVYCFLIVGATVYISNLVQSTCFAKSGEELTLRVRCDALRAVLRQNVAYFDDPRNSVGAVAARLAHDASRIQGATGIRLGSSLQSVFGLGAAVGISFYFSWQLALLACAFVPLYALGTVLQMRTAGGGMCGRDDRRGSEEAGTIATAATMNMRTVKSLSLEEKFLHHYSQRLEGRDRCATANALIRGLIFGYSQSIIMFNVAGCYYYGGWLVANDLADFSDVFRVLLAITFGTLAVGQANTFAPDLVQATQSAARIIALLDRVPDPDSYSQEGRRLSGGYDEGEAECTMEGKISYNSVEFSYPNRPQARVLKDFSEEILPGQTVAFVGQSGCGKSTCIQLLQRFYDPSYGAVMYDSDDTRNLHIGSLRRKLGVVSQEPVLFDRSIAANIRYGDTRRTASMDEVVAAARASNIHDFIEALPQGYETRVGAKGTQLSGGQKQRIAIARALLRKPKVLLLDEATSALDDESEKIVQAALDKAGEGRTCIVIAHRLSTVQNADRICVVEAGRVVESGTHAQLFARRSAYHGLVKAQMRYGPEIPARHSSFGESLR